MEPGQIAERVKHFQQQQLVVHGKAAIGSKPTKLECIRKHRDNIHKCAKELGVKWNHDGALIPRRDERNPRRDERNLRLSNEDAFHAKAPRQPASSSTAKPQGTRAPRLTSPKRHPLDVAVRTEPRYTRNEQAAESISPLRLSPPQVRSPRRDAPSVDVGKELQPVESTVATFDANRSVEDLLAQWRAQHIVCQQEVSALPAELPVICLEDSFSDPDVVLRRIKLRLGVNDLGDDLAPGVEVFGRPSPKNSLGVPVDNPEDALQKWRDLISSVSFSEPPIAPLSPRGVDALRAEVDALVAAPAPITEVSYHAPLPVDPQAAECDVTYPLSPLGPLFERTGGVLGPTYQRYAPPGADTTFARPAPVAAGAPVLPKTPLLIQTDVSPADFFGPSPKATPAPTQQTPPSPRRPLLEQTGERATQKPAPPPKATATDGNSPQAATDAQERRTPLTPEAGQALAKHGSASPPCSRETEPGCRRVVPPLVIPSPRSPHRVDNACPSTSPARVSANVSRGQSLTSLFDNVTQLSQSSGILDLVALPPGVAPVSQPYGCIRDSILTLSRDSNDTDVERAQEPSQRYGFQESRGRCIAAVVQRGDDGCAAAPVMDTPYVPSPVSLHPRVNDFPPHTTPHNADIAPRKIETPRHAWTNAEVSTQTSFDVGSATRGREIQPEGPTGTYDTQMQSGFTAYAEERYPWGRIENIVRQLPPLPAPPKRTPDDAVLKTYMLFRQQQALLAQ